MRLHELPYEIDMSWVCDSKQHDWQIAGDCIAPKSGLVAAIFEEQALSSAQRRIGVDHRARKPAIKLCVGLRGVDLSQQYLAVRPGKVEGTFGETWILVFIYQLQA